MIPTISAQFCVAVHQLQWNVGIRLLIGFSCWWSRFLIWDCKTVLREVIYISWSHRLLKKQILHRNPVTPKQVSTSEVRLIGQPRARTTYLGRWGQSFISSDKSFILSNNQPKCLPAFVIFMNLCLWLHPYFLLINEVFEFGDNFLGLISK